jgi:hypothetical protein
MRELERPKGVDSDADATEMVRYWLANDEPHVKLLIGMYQDAEDCDVDELYAWGHILRDIAQHVANGLKKSYGWDFNESCDRVAQHFNEAMKNRSGKLDGEVTGGE